MICRKCGHQWFIQEIPIPKDLDCPICGAPIYKDGKYVEPTGTVKCRICGKPLRVPLSVERGVGPRCWAALKRKESNGSSSCYGSYGSKECIIEDCTSRSSCEKEETKRFEQARRVLNE